MEQAKQSNDEIDLFELFQTLWQGKWLIVAFVVLALVVGGVVVATKQPSYQSSRINAPFDTLPPFYGQGQAAAEFNKLFTSEQAFDAWKEDNSDSTLTYDALNSTYSVEGFVFAKSSNLVAIQSNAVVIRSKNLELLSDVFSYTQNINDQLTAEYIEEAKDEIETMKSLYKDFSSPSEPIIQNLLSINRYIEAAEGGAKVFSIKPPTYPSQIPVKKHLILALSVVLGGMLGVFWVLIRSVIRKHNAK